MRFTYLLLLVLPVGLMGCPEVDPRTICAADTDCHERYVCDPSTKTCLRSCSANNDCIDKSQICDTNICRTACLSAEDCDPAYQCIKDAEAAATSTGVCKDE